MSVWVYEICVNCEHWWAFHNNDSRFGWGFCRLNPPTHGLFGSQKWPKTRYADTCGSWEDAWEDETDTDSEKPTTTDQKPAKLP